MCNDVGVLSCCCVCVTAGIKFKRFYNIYFLCAAIFVCAEPSLSPVTEILPLALVLTITAIKDALEDYVSLNVHSYDLAPRS